jgi:alkanesulfonate monooxygenase SsuD/methylene tetrahydromethanopterin reductase-like flavin-dependent oxidoreductase (luciferase family)
MNLGFFTMPIHPLDKDWRLSLRQDREAFLLADELGFTEAYVGEHVTDKAENITSCIAFIAWVAAATKQIRLAPARSTCRTPIRPPSRPAWRCWITCSTAA